MEIKTCNNWFSTEDLEYDHRHTSLFQHNENDNDNEKDFTKHKDSL